MGNLMSDNISTIYGSNFLLSLMPISMSIDVEIMDQKEELNLNNDLNNSDNDNIDDNDNDNDNDNNYNYNNNNSNNDNDDIFHYNDKNDKNDNDDNHKKKENEIEQDQYQINNFIYESHIENSLLSRKDPERNVEEKVDKRDFYSILNLQNPIIGISNKKIDMIKIKNKEIAKTEYNCYDQFIMPSMTYIDSNITINENDITDKSINTNNSNDYNQKSANTKITEAMKITEVEQSVISQKKKCTISGFISRVGTGIGRSDNDRQFIFCNGRPVDLPKFSKVLNEVRNKIK